MGPWSAGGVRIGMKERYRWEARGEIRDAHERTVYAVDWKEGGASRGEGGLGRIVSAGGDGRVNVYQMASSYSGEREASLRAADSPVLGPFRSTRHIRPLLRAPNLHRNQRPMAQKPNPAHPNRTRPQRALKRSSWLGLKTPTASRT